MGDIIHALPVLAALRRKFPEARIGWVAEQNFAPLVEEHPAVDVVIKVRLRAWRKNLKSTSVRQQIVKAFKDLRAFKADLALDLMGNHKGGLLAWLSGAPRTLGADKAGRREGSSVVWINEAIPTSGKHAVDLGLDLLKPLGARPEEADFGPQQILPKVPPPAQEFLRQQERPYVVIQAGAGWGNKTYPVAWWGEVAQGLRDKLGMDVWVPIAPGEEDLAQGVVSASAGAARSVDAKDLAFLAALMRRSRLVLGGDTGPIHLAHALGRRVLCLIGPTDPERNGPYESPEQVLWHPLPCSKCYKRFAEPKACLLSLPPSLVIDRARQLLAASVP